MLARARPGNVLPRPAFTTPFKANMKPGESGRLEAEKEKERKKLEAADRAERERSEQERKAKERNGAVFNLCKQSVLLHGTLSARAETDVTSH